jgi:hypothetical protein
MNFHIKTVTPYKFDWLNVLTSKNISKNFPALHTATSLSRHHLSSLSGTSRSRPHVRCSVAAAAPSPPSLPIATAMSLQARRRHCCSVAAAASSPLSLPRAAAPSSLSPSRHRHCRPITAVAAVAAVANVAVWSLSLLSRRCLVTVPAPSSLLRRCRCCRCCRCGCCSLLSHCCRVSVGNTEV